MRESNERLDEQLTRVPLLSILRNPPKDDRGRDARLDGREFGGGEELGGGGVDEGLPHVLVEAFDTAVEGHSRLLVRLRGNNGVDAIAIECERADGETVRVAADDGVGVLLGYMSRGVFGTNQYVVCLCTL